MLCHFAVPTVAQEGGPFFPCQDPHWVLGSFLSVAPMARGQAAPGSSSTVLWCLLLQSRPSAHDLWRCGNVAGIRTSLDLSHLPYTYLSIFPSHSLEEGPIMYLVLQDRAWWFLNPPRGKRGNVFKHDCG